MELTEEHTEVMLASKVQASVGWPSRATETGVT